MYRIERKTAVLQITRAPGLFLIAITAPLSVLLGVDRLERGRPIQIIGIQIRSKFALCDAFLLQFEPNPDRTVAFAFAHVDVRLGETLIGQQALVLELLDGLLYILFDKVFLLQFSTQLKSRMLASSEHSNGGIKYGQGSTRTRHDRGCPNSRSG